MGDLDKLREENRAAYAADIQVSGYEARVAASNARYVPALEAEAARLRLALETIGPVCRMWHDACWEHDIGRDQWCGGCIAAEALDPENYFDGPAGSVEERRLEHVGSPEGDTDG